MGFAVPAAIGAKSGHAPTAQVVAVDGDGCFQMTCQELITAAVENIPIKVAVFNNAAHGMVRQWQRLFYNERYSSSDLGGGLPRLRESWPRPWDAPGCAPTAPEDEVDEAIARLLEVEDRPVVAEFAGGPRRDGVPHGSRRGLQRRRCMTGPEDL